MNIKAEIVVEEKENINALHNAIKPEIIDKERTQLKIEKQDDKVVMNIDSKDAVAFRATINSISQMLSVFEKMKNIKKDNK